MATQLQLHDLGTPMNNAVEKVRRGEEVTIADHGQTVAKIIAIEPTRQPEFESLKGLIEMTDDFNDPLLEDEIREWEQ